MKEDAVAVNLAKFANDVRKEIKGLSSKVVWHIYGRDCDYVQGVDEGEELEHGMRRIPKMRQDWETYVLLYGAGAIQGHMTGRAERKGGGGYTGKLEDDKSTQYIHQLFASNCSTLKVQCGLAYPALSERVELMNVEPQRTAAILFFQEYLRSIYRSVAGADAEILLEHLETLPGDTSPAELFEKWKEVELKLKREKRPAIYEVKDGKFFVFEKTGKKNRLVNGWLFGIEEEESEGGETHDDDGDFDYESKIANAAFHTRMSLLLTEAARLLDDENSELIALVGEHQNGTMKKVLATIEKLQELAESNMLEEQQKPGAKLLMEKTERIASMVSKHSRILSRVGIDVEYVKACAQKAQKLKRKV